MPFSSSNHRQPLIILEALFLVLLPVLILPLPSAASELSNTTTRNRALLPATSSKENGSRIPPTRSTSPRAARLSTRNSTASNTADPISSSSNSPGSTTPATLPGLMGWIFSRDGVGRRLCLWVIH